MRDYLRASDLVRLPDEIMQLYDKAAVVEGRTILDTLEETVTA